MDNKKSCVSLNYGFEFACFKMYYYDYDEFGSYAGPEVEIDPEVDYEATQEKRKILNVWS